MFIEDDELRNLFKTASEEHLQKLEAGVLQIEQQPDDLTPLEELLREAHSLKGDARMLGVNDVETLAHQVEHFLGAIARHELTAESELCDRLYQGLDAMRQLVQEAVTGEPSGVDTFHALAQLMGASAPPAPAGEPSASSAASEQPSQPAAASQSSQSPEPTESRPAPAAATNQPDATSTSEPEPEPEPTAPAATIEVELPSSGAVVPATQPTAAGRTATAGEPYRIETIRVGTRHLDDLMTQAGELTVTKIRIAHVAAEIEELAALWDEWESGNSSENFGDRVATAIQNLRGAAYENSSRLEAIAGNLEARIRTLRLLPLSNVFQLFPRLVRDLARAEAKEIDFVVEGGDTNADKRILEEMKDPLMHLLRNAIDHGIELPSERERRGKPRRATLKIVGYQTASNIIIEVSDDGRGLDLEKIQQTALRRNLYRREELEAMSASQIYNLIFLPGFSTQAVVTEVSGRGVGLDVVYTNVERLKGSLQVNSQPGQGTTFRIQLGTTLATANVLLVAVRGVTYAIPVEFVQTSLLVAPESIFTLEGRSTIALEGQAVSVAELADLLELDMASSNSSEPQSRPCILLRVGDEQFGLLVDDLIDTQDVVLKPQSQLLKRVRNVAGATILGTGAVCIILNPLDLLKSLQRSRHGSAAPQRPAAQAIASPAESRPTAILLVEDSIAIRTQEKRILEGAGYKVTTAVDGADGLSKLQAQTFDAVVSDIQMPNLDGLELTRRIRNNREYNELPIVLVTSLASDEDKRRGVEAGANAYITKGSFNQEVLLETLQRFV